jgi:hypothetical protein
MHLYTKNDFLSSPIWSSINRFILATKLHKGTQRKEDNKSHLNKSFYGGGQGGAVFSKRVPPWPPEAKIIFIYNSSI